MIPSCRLARAEVGSARNGCLDVDYWSRTEIVDIPEFKAGCCELVEAVQGTWWDKRGRQRLGGY